MYDFVVNLFGFCLWVLGFLYQLPTCLMPGKFYQRIFIDDTYLIVINKLIGKIREYRKDLN